MTPHRSVGLAVAWNQAQEGDSRGYPAALYGPDHLRKSSRAALTAAAVSGYIMQ
jgi:hypothetical protein